MDNFHYGDGEVWVLRQFSGERFKVTEGLFTYVHIDDEGRPTQINKTDIKN
ncbi:MAG: hypothetical protein R2827_02185 [Bdellovibrionales bacterium]